MPTSTRGALAVGIALAGLAGCQRDQGLGRTPSDLAVAIDATGDRDAAAPPDLVDTPDLRVCQQGSPRAPIDPLPVRFPTRRSFVTGGPSASVLPVDVDKDGHLDLVLGPGWGGPALRVVRGRGDGTFELPAGTDDPNAEDGLLIAADLDHRGGLDVVAVGTALATYLGRGDGSFTVGPRSPEVPTALNGAATRPYAAGDFDGDGAVDVILASVPMWVGAPTLVVMLGGGDGSFRRGPTLTLDGYRKADHLAAADLDGDRHLDLAVVTDLGTLLLAGQGDGSFDAKRLGVLAAAGVPFLADVDRDGRLDVLLTGDAFGSLLARGLGGGRFAAPAHVDLPNSQETALLLADLDGDGALDFLALRDSLAFYRGDGKGRFARPVNLPAGDWNRGMGHGDFDEDGVEDVAVSEQANRGEGDLVIVSGADLSGHGAVNFSFGSGWAGMYSLAAGDLDGDGHPDLVAGGEVGLEVLLGDGHGGFQPAPFSDLPLQGAFDLALGDLDADGVLDLVATEAVENRFGYWGSPVFARGLGGGRFAAFAPTPGGPIWAEAGATFAVTQGDLYGDGRLDVVLPSHSGLRVVRNLGGGAFAFGETLDSPFAWSVTAGDLDGDGKVDLVAALPFAAEPPDGRVAFFSGLGDGTFRAGPDLARGDHPLVVRAADLDGDGLADLVVGSEHALRVLLSRCGGPPVESARYPFLTTGVAVTDLNGDGVPDLVVSRSGSAWPLPVVTICDVYCTSPGLAVLLGRGDGTFAPPATYRAGPLPRQISVADFNGDGRPDLAVANAGATTLTVLPALP